MSRTETSGGQEFGLLTPTQWENAKTKKKKVYYGIKKSASDHMK